jgi:hypothetical protein
MPLPEAPFVVKNGSNIFLQSIRGDPPTVVAERHPATHAFADPSIHAAWISWCESSRHWAWHRLALIPCDSKPSGGARP